MNKIERYQELIITHPYLFSNPKNGNYPRIITNIDEMYQAQNIFHENAISNGLPEKFFDLGVISEDQWYFTIRDLVQFVNGELGAYVRFVCKKGDFQEGYNVAILPFTCNKVMITRQFSHTYRKWHWQTPRGFGEKGLSAEENASKELLEETGLVSFRLYNVATDTDDTTYLFLAAINGDAEFRPIEDEIEEAKWVDLETMKEYILSGKIFDSYTMMFYIYLTTNGFPGGL